MGSSIPHGVSGSIDIHQRRRCQLLVRTVALELPTTCGTVVYVDGLRIVPRRSRCISPWHHPSLGLSLTHVGRAWGPQVAATAGRADDVMVKVGDAPGWRERTRSSKIQSWEYWDGPSRFAVVQDIRRTTASVSLLRRPPRSHFQGELLLRGFFSFDRLPSQSQTPQGAISWLSGACDSAPPCGSGGAPSCADRVRACEVEAFEVGQDYARTGEHRTLQTMPDGDEKKLHELDTNVLQLESPSIRTTHKAPDFL
jgi:hypothetical protein